MAAACIIVTPEKGILLQHRDDRENIWFPGYWGCFGGALELDESTLEAAARELTEELSICVEEEELKYFSEITFDLTTIGSTLKYRCYYIFKITTDQESAIKLTEGQAFRAFTKEEILSTCFITPYDRMMLVQYIMREDYVPTQFKNTS